MSTVSGLSYPILHSRRLYNISIFDKNIYEFEIGSSFRMVKRYPIGGKAKVILKKADSVLIAYQEYRLLNSYVEIIEFNFNSKESKVLLGKSKVIGLMKNNIIKHDNWIYAWSYTSTGNVKVSTTDGYQYYEFNLNGLKETEIETIGFNLSYPMLNNTPILEVKSKSGPSIFRIFTDKAPIELPSLNDNDIVNEGMYRQAVDRMIYHSLYLKKGKLIGVEKNKSLEDEASNTRWVPTKVLNDQLKNSKPKVQPNTYILDILDNTGNTMNKLKLQGFIFPEYLIDMDIESIEKHNDAVVIQTDLVNYYQDELARNKQQLKDYSKEDKLRDYLGTPTSVMFILLQAIMLLGTVLALKDHGKAKVRKK